MTESRNHHPAKALTREHMPCDYKISLDQYLSRNSRCKGYREGEVRIPENFGPKQSLQGFEDRYQNIIDYIVRITHKIWEDRDVEYIGDTYSPNSLVFDDYGLQPADALFVLRSLFGDSLAQATQIHNNRKKL